LKILLLNNIITYYDHDLRNVENLKGDNIYNLSYITDVKWKAGEKTMFIIIGDLVDGMRIDEKTVVNDPRGSFEILLHSLIHNMRIKAQLQSSDVRFTLGNHDVESLILEPEIKSYSYYADMYVHPTSRGFFNSLKTRRATLLPFYNNSPYIFLNLKSQPNEFIFVHAGLHKPKYKNVSIIYDNDRISAVEPIQTNINNIINEKQNTVEEGFKKNALKDQLVEILNNRSYETKITDCASIDNNPIAIVGHCPTTFNGDKLINGRPEYAHCEVDLDVNNVKKGVGCVVLQCSHSNPKVAMVDTASSQAFRYDNGDNYNREVEILKMSLSEGTYKLERQLNGVSYSFEKSKAEQDKEKNEKQNSMPVSEQVSEQVSEPKSDSEPKPDSEPKSDVDSISTKKGGKSRKIKKNKTKRRTVNKKSTRRRLKYKSRNSLKR
jgi:hypothetical protein